MGKGRGRKEKEKSCGSDIRGAKEDGETPMRPGGKKDFGRHQSEGVRADHSV